MIKIVFLATFGLLYFIYRHDLYRHGSTILIGSLMMALIVTLIQVFPLRNDPNYAIYYLIDPRRFSKLAKLILFIMFVAIPVLYFFAQCQAYNTNFSVKCVLGILDGSLKNSFKLKIL